MSSEINLWLVNHWSEIKDFFIAIVGSLAGAFAGAYGAQRIIERAKLREDLIKEIRNSNATIMISFAVCNSILGLKKQHVKRIKETFDKQKKDFLDFQKKREERTVSSSEFYFVADLQTLSLPKLPVEVQQKQVFEKLSIIGRPLSLTTTLTQTIHSFSASLEKRNQLIELFKSVGSNDPRFVTLYFGLPMNGHVNKEYPDMVDAIWHQTDDGIYFSKLLCQDLVEYGQSISKQFKRKFGKGSPSVNKPDFSKAENADLMPKDENYSDWTSMFVRQAVTLNRKDKIKAFLLQTMCKRQDLQKSNTILSRTTMCGQYSS